MARASNYIVSDLRTRRWTALMNVSHARDQLGLSQKALPVLRALLQALPDKSSGSYPSCIAFLTDAHGPMSQTGIDELAHGQLIRIVVTRAGVVGYDLAPLIEREAELETLAAASRATGRDLTGNAS